MYCLIFLEMITVTSRLSIQKSRTAATKYLALGRLRASNNSIHKRHVPIYWISKRWEYFFGQYHVYQIFDNATRFLQKKLGNMSLRLAGIKPRIFFGWKWLLCPLCRVLMDGARRKNWKYENMKWRVQSNNFVSPRIEALKNFLKYYHIKYLGDPTEIRA